MALGEADFQTSEEKKAVTRQKYYDPVRGEQIGYASEGRVYEDADLSRRIAVGSVVPTLGGTFLLTEQGSVRMDAAANAGTYGAAGGLLAQYESAARQASLAAADGEIRALTAQKPGIEQTYDQLARKAYQAYRTGQEGLANRLSSAGLYNSGYADTVVAGQQTAYQERLNENEQARADALTRLEQEILRQQSAQKAAESGLAAEMARLRLSQYNTEQSLAQKAEESRLAEEWRQKNFEAGRDDELWNREYALDKDAKAKAAKAAAGQKIPSGGSAGGGKSAAAEKTAPLSALSKAELERDALSLAATFYKDGDKFHAFLQHLGQDSVRKMYESKYGAAGYDYLTKQAIAAYEAQKSGQGSALSLSAAQVQALAASLMSQLAAGSLTVQKLREYLDTAGFDKNTRTLLEMYISGALG